MNKFSCFRLLCCTNTKAKQPQRRNRNESAASQAQQNPGDGRLNANNQQRAQERQQRRRLERAASARESADQPSTRADINSRQSRGNRVDVQSARQRSYSYCSEEESDANPVKVSNIVLESHFQTEDIDFCDFLPEDRDQRHKYKFYCPICLRYFTHILQSGCCENYICHLCVDDLKDQERKTDQFVAKCAYGCTQDKFLLKDVNPDDKVKRYSDSQKMSCYSNNLAANVKNATFSSKGQNTFTRQGNDARQGFDNYGSNPPEGRDKSNSSPTEIASQIPGQRLETSTFRRAQHREAQTVNFKRADYAGAEDCQLSNSVPRRQPMHMSAASGFGSAARQFQQSNGQYLPPLAPVQGRSGLRSKQGEELLRIPSPTNHDFSVPRNRSRQDNDPGQNSNQIMSGEFNVVHQHNHVAHSPQLLSPPDALNQYQTINQFSSEEHHSVTKQHQVLFPAPNQNDQILIPGGFDLTSEKNDAGGHYKGAQTNLANLNANIQQHKIGKDQQSQFAEEESDCPTQNQQFFQARSLPMAPPEGARVQGSNIGGQTVLSQEVTFNGANDTLLNRAISPAEVQQPDLLTSGTFYLQGNHGIEVAGAAEKILIHPELPSSDDENDAHSSDDDASDDLSRAEIQ